MIRILLVDNHRMFTEALTRVIESELDMVVLGDAPDGDAAMALLQAQAFDVAVMEINLPGKSGLHWLKVIKEAYPKLPILILTMCDEQQYAVRCIKSGAAGYLTKAHNLAGLLTAMRRLAAGQGYITPTVNMLIAKAVGNRSGVHRLTDRDIETLRLLAFGYTATEIAEQLQIKAKAVAAIRDKLLRAFDTHTTAALVRVAKAEGIVTD
jgi:DNA-binding NarL/FixJ family response regulator